MLVNMGDWVRSRGSGGERGGNRVFYNSGVWAAALCSSIHRSDESVGGSDWAVCEQAVSWSERRGGNDILDEKTLKSQQPYLSVSWPQLLAPRESESRNPSLEEGL